MHARRERVMVTPEEHLEARAEPMIPLRTARMVAVLALFGGCFGGLTLGAVLWL